MNKRVIGLTGIMLAVSLSFGLYKSSFNRDAAPVNSTNINQTNSTTNQTKYYAPYIGEEVSMNTYSNIPFMAVIENSKSARPQSGLSEADIVYETMAEGGIPRFIALFQKNSPKEIGPIRSLRPYFIDISKEYNLPFVHCGGSEEALDYVKTESLMSMNEMNYASYFWRDQTRKSPHNLYTSSSKIRELITSKSYITPVSSSLKFDQDYWKNSELSNANNISLKLNSSYSTAYELKDSSYYKSMDNVPATDRANGKNIDVKNIIVQITNIKLQSDGSHIDIDVVGKGKGYVISGGKYIKMNWSRNDLKSPTLLVDDNGKEITLIPGKTWWHIVDNKAAITFN